MQNFAYIITDRQENGLFKKSIKSLRKYSKCHVVLSVTDDKSWAANYCKSECGEDLTIIKLDPSLWNNRRMANKIENLKLISLSVGDRVFVLDDDLIFQGDIFSAFDSIFDVCVTSRHYPYWYVINGGVWGFEYSERSKMFIDYFIAQINNPTWKPLLSFRGRFNRGSSLDWWVDQDFLCVVKDSPLPFECKVKDIGYSYNFCPSVEYNIPGTFESSRAQILNAIGNKDIKVLHLKGRLKEIEGEICV